MEKISLTYENGKKFQVYAIRYFKFKNNNYFIYTLGEKDDRNYIKLYVVKIMKELGILVSQTVRRKDEWDLMKGIIKTILSEIKKGELKSIVDLNYHDLQGTTIYEAQNFRLASDLVDTLSTSLSDIHIATDSSLITESNNIQLQEETSLLSSNEVISIPSVEIQQLVSPPSESKTNFDTPIDDSEIEVLGGIWDISEQNVSSSLEELVASSKELELQADIMTENSNVENIDPSNVIENEEPEEEIEILDL